jgi:hypothetical protein
MLPMEVLLAECAVCIRHGVELEVNQIDFLEKLLVGNDEGLRQKAIDLLCSKSGVDHAERMAH